MDNLVFFSPRSWSVIVATLLLTVLGGSSSRFNQSRIYIYIVFQHLCLSQPLGLDRSRSTSSKSRPFLVGGFNAFEKYESNVKFDHFPRDRGENSKNI